MRPDRRSRFLLGFLVAAQTLWCAWFVWRTSFPVGGDRTFCLFDDAMISMTYARNLVEGYGLNWARFGEPVEGFTAPLWVLAMAAVHLLPLELRTTSLAVQILSGGLLVANTLAVRHLVVRHFSGRIGDRHGGASRAVPAGAWLPAAVLTAFYYPLAHWSLQGMETGLQALITTLAVTLGLAIGVDGERSRGAYGFLFALLAAGYLTRMDMALVAAVVVGFLAWRGALAWRDRNRWLPGLALLAGAVAGYQLFRWLYFGELLPNTYYLKLVGVPLDVRLLRGAWALWRFALPLLPVLAGIGLGASVLLRRTRDRAAGARFALPGAVVIACAAYSVWVGGDAWERAGIGANRFLAVAVPLLFVLWNGVLDEWRAGAGRRARTARAWGVAGATALTLLLADGLWSTEGWRRALVLDRPLHVNGHARFVRQTVRLAESGKIPADARVAVVWAGIPAYFSSWEMVDLLGYNDRQVARQEPSVPLGRKRWRDFRPGHVKLGYRHALEAHRPDLIFQTWRPDGADWAPELRELGYRKRGLYWVREGGAATARTPAPRKPSRP